VFAIQLPRCATPDAEPVGQESARSVMCITFAIP
jgi:hypothetical protein